jgi:GWxTD domain-containing protein
VDGSSLMKIFRAILYSLILFVLAFGCKSQRMANIDRGSDVTYREGYPEVRILAVGLFDENDLPGVDLTVDIVKGSLVYRSVDGIFSASVQMTIQISQVINRENILIQNRTQQLVVSDPDQRIVDSGEVASYTERIPLLPGDYVILVSVVDESSGNQSVRRTNTSIPDPESDEVGITSVLLLGKMNDNDDGFVPITTYFVQSRYDSLKFQFQVTRPEVDFDTQINMGLYTFNADSVHARELAGIPPSPGSIAYKGIEYQRVNEVFSTSRTLRTETGSILIEYITSILPSANYRFEVNVTNMDTDESRLFKAREFNITTPFFPSVRNIREFAEPLAYLMGRREFDRLMQIRDADSLKTAVDLFWLSGMRNSNRARQVIELYYSRVEQANKQFSNFKEGWKTDMGMVFILFGPPYYVENTLDSSIWFYSYNRSDPRTTFRFIRPKIADQFFPYQHYILQRERYYHSIEYDMVESWKRGSVLNMN